MKQFPFYLFPCFLIFLSCSKDNDVAPVKPIIPCTSETQDLGTILLEEESITYFPYTTETERIRFKNEIGESVLFVPKYGPLNSLPVFTRFNHEFECEDGSMTSYISTIEQYAAHFSCEELDLNIGSNLLPISSFVCPLFRDRLRLQVYVDPNPPSTFVDSLITMRIITHFRGNEEEFKNEMEFTDYDFLDEIKLLDRTFNNVYRTTRTDRLPLTAMYFTKEEGVVAFMDLERVLWVLD